AAGPSPRDHAAMSFDPDRRHVVMVGGRTSSPRGPISSAETWEWEFNFHPVIVSLVGPEFPRHNVHAAFTVQTELGDPGFPDSGPESCQWYNGCSPLADDARVSGSRTDRLQFNPLMFDDAGGYHVVVSDACGISTSEDVDITVYCAGDWDRNGVVDSRDFFS